MDPRSLGFNYGAPIKCHWHPLAAVQGYADQLRLNHRASTFNPEPRTECARHRASLSWSLDMAIRDVRHACSHEEQRRAIARCSSVFAYVFNAIENTLDGSHLERI